MHPLIQLVSAIAGPGPSTRRVKPGSAGKRFEREGESHERPDALEIAQIGTWTWDFAADEVTWSRELCRIYGLGPVARGSSREFLGHVVREDRPVIEEAIEQAVREAGTFDFHYRVGRPDGAVRVLHGRGVAVAGEDVPARVFGTAQDVTEQWEAEEALARSETRYRLLAENSTDVICVSDAAGILRYVSPSVRQLFGWDPEDLVGRSGFELLHPEDMTVAESAARMLESPGLVTVAYRSRRADGEFVWVESTVRQVTDPRSGEVVELQASVRDITDRKHAEEEVRRLAAIVESSSDAIVAMTPEGKITSLNRGAERLYGYESAEAIGKPMEMLFPSGQSGKEQDLLVKVLAGGTVEDCETRQVRKDGTPVEVSLSLSEIRDSSNSVVGISSIARDVTSRKRSEDALRQSDLLKTALLRAVSHDLRSPLTAIVAAGESIASSNLDLHGRRELASVIVGEASRLSRLVEKLLDLSRLQGGAALPRLIWCSIEEIVEAALEQMPGRGADFELSISPNLPLLRVDPAQLERALANLFENARRFANAQPVEVRASAADGKLRIEVADRGPGLAEAERKQVFEPFYQANGERSRHGSGLGLAIVKGFVEVNGGTVSVQSREGEGATFVVDLPVTAEQERDVGT